MVGREWVNEPFIAIHPTDFVIIGGEKDVPYNRVIQVNSQDTNIFTVIKRLASITVKV